jgi:putative methionine-R-sulfoxide reductase with GAF domain
MSNLSILSLFSDFGFKSIRIEMGEKVLLDKGDKADFCYSLSFEEKEIGLLFVDLEKEKGEELAKLLSPLVFLELTAGLWDYAGELLSWVQGAKNLAPEVSDWIGIYYKANYFLKRETTDLYLGPFFGEPTDHKIIPLSEGLCGLALREERVVNVKDVNEDDRHIACSLKTKSELIVPLKNKEGMMVAELDIDCHHLNAFTPEIEAKIQEYCLSFPDIS